MVYLHNKSHLFSFRYFFLHWTHSEPEKFKMSESEKSGDKGELERIVSVDGSRPIRELQHDLEECHNELGRIEYLKNALEEQLNVETGIDAVF